MRACGSQQEVFNDDIVFFFFNDTATTEIYTLSLHDALPISAARVSTLEKGALQRQSWPPRRRDRKSTRLNSSHMSISYAVFCLKKKKQMPVADQLATPLPPYNATRLREDVH